MRILSVADASELITLPTTTIFPSGWMATERPTDPVSSAPGIAGLVTTPPLPNDPSSAPELVNLATSRVAPDWTPDWPTATTLPSLCTAAPNRRGVADRTHRGARQALLGSGELNLLRWVGGRGNTNHWQVMDPRQVAGEARRPSSGRRVAPPAGARPLVVPLAEPRT